MLREVEQHFRVLDPQKYPEFDHYTPSRYLISEGVELGGAEAAVDRFEALFADLNALL